MSIEVYVSVGRPFSKEQEHLIATVEAHLHSSGLKPRTVGRNGYNYREPLRAIHNMMKRCSGALVIALERVTIKSGAERWRAPDEVILQNVTLATPWNQIEAALAYARRIPILVLREKTVKEEGILETRHDWYVHPIDMSGAFMNSSEFADIYDAWCRDVRRRAGQTSLRE